MPDIQIASPDGRFSAYLARPTKTPAPALLVIQEVLGVNQNMRQLCDSFAEAGYLAVCPDLFWRQEPGVQLSDKTEADLPKAMALRQGFDQEKGIADLLATAAHLKGMKECNGRIGSVGYCLGGRLAFLLAARSELAAHVCYYGTGLDRVLNEASAIKRPLLMHIPEDDQHVPAEVQKAVRQAVAGNAQVTVHAYPGCGHAFARPGSRFRNPTVAEQADGRTAAFLKKHLG